VNKTRLAIKKGDKEVNSKEERISEILSLIEKRISELDVVDVKKRLISMAIEKLRDSCDDWEILYQFSFSGDNMAEVFLDELCSFLDDFSFYPEGRVDFEDVLMGVYKKSEDIVDKIRNVLPLTSLRVEDYDAGCIEIYWNDIGIIARYVDMI